MRKVHIGELIYHLIVFVMFVGAISMDLGFPAHRVTYGGRLKYYTIWNVWLAIIYYGFSTLVDLVHLCIDDKSTSIRKMRDYVFCSLVVPASLNVSIAFWVLYAISPDNILPKSEQQYQPVLGYFNQVAHTGPIVSTVIEAIMVFHQPPSSFIVGCLGGLLYGTAYAVWVYWIEFKAGFWVYPFLAAMSDAQRFCYFGVCYGFGFFCYHVMVSIIQCVWKKDLLSIGPDGKSKKN